MPEMSPKQKKQHPLSKVKYLSVCPFCNTKFSIKQAKIVAETKDSFLVHSYCKKCSCSVLASLTSSQMGISSIGLVTDLTYRDVMKFRNADAISVDNILETYSYLKS